MFKAIIIVCSMFFEQCIELHDTEGPYLELQQCFNRLVIMEENILAISEVPIRYQKHCVQLKDGKEYII